MINKGSLDGGLQFSPGRYLNCNLQQRKHAQCSMVSKRFAHERIVVGESLRIHVSKHVIT